VLAGSAVRRGAVHVRVPRTEQAAERRSAGRHLEVASRPVALLDAEPGQRATLRPIEPRQLEAAERERACSWLGRNEVLHR
jgi:hypothetical protein